MIAIVHRKQLVEELKFFTNALPQLIHSGDRICNMRIGILTPTQDVGTQPYRYVAKSAKASLLRRRLCVKVYDQSGGPIAHLLREIRIGSVPTSDSARFLKASPVAIPVLNAPGLPETLLLQYPLPDESSFRRANRRRIWTNRTYFGPQVWDENILCDNALAQETMPGA